MVPWFDALMVFCAKPLIILLAVGVMVALRGRAIELLVLIAASWVIGVALQQLINRLRPYKMLKENPLSCFWTPTFSFPSVHATTAFALAWSVGGGFGIGAMAIATLIAVSRVWVGVHYPTDIAAGAVLGIAISSVLL